MVEVDLEVEQAEVEVLLLLHFEEVLLEVQGVLDHLDEAVQGVLDHLDEVEHLELVDDDVHLELVDVDEVEHLELVDNVFEELQGVEVDLDLLQPLVDDLVEVVHGLVEVVEVVQGLLDEVEQGVEHFVLVKVVAGVQVQVLQVVVTIGLPAVVMRVTSQRSEVVVAGWHSLPDSQVTDGQTGPVS